MAPKEPFKVHSLSKHIEDTKKGLSAEAQYNRRPVARPSAAAVKREPGMIDANIFGHNTDSEDDESSDSDSSSDDEDGADFLKKLGAKTSSTAPKRRSQNDEIADSDVERNASAKTAADMKEKHVATESSETSDESSSEPESDESEPKVKTNGVAANDSTSTSDTSSSGSEDGSNSEKDSEASSDEEEEPQAPATKPVVKAATNGKAKATTSNSSSEESEEEESEEEESEEEESEEEESEDEEPAKPAQKKVQAAEESSSRESETSDDEDEDVDQSMHISEREDSTQVAIPNFIAPDFVLRKSEDGANGQDVVRICNQANLQGKQVWYFTVPSNVPISVVQNLEIPTDRAQLGDRVFSYDGHDYGVSFDTMAPKSSIQILIPSADNSNYQPARQQVNQTMQIKRITNLGSAGSSSVGPAPNRAPRPQPKGLKARYQPFGVNTPMGRIGVDASSDVDEDVEMAEAPASSAAPKSSKKDKKAKKNEAAVESEQPKSKKDKKKRGDGVNEPAASQTTSRAAEVQTLKADRKGKRKHTSSEEDAVAAADQLREETNMTAQTRTKKQKTGRTGSPDLGSEPPSAAKKQTPIAPPTIPQSSASFASLGSVPVASTPGLKAKAPVAGSAVKKSAKKAKAGTPAPASSQPAPATGVRQTPVPVPRQTAVPLPNMILSSRPKESPVPIPPTGAITGTPTPSKGKRAKKQKEDEAKATPSSQQRALAGDKKKTPAIKKKVG